MPGIWWHWTCWRWTCVRETDRPLWFLDRAKACKALWDCNCEWLKEYNWFDLTSSAPARHGSWNLMKSLSVIYNLYETSLHTLKSTPDSACHRIGVPAFGQGLRFKSPSTGGPKDCSEKGSCLCQGKGIFTLKVITIPSRHPLLVSCRSGLALQYTVVRDTYGSISTCKHWYHYIRKGTLPQYASLGLFIYRMSVYTFFLFLSLHYHTCYLIQKHPMRNILQLLRQGTFRLTLTTEV